MSIKLESKKQSKELVMKEHNSVLPLSERPDYLPQDVKITGIEALGPSDFKTPRVVLLQGLSPELKLYAGLAKVDEYWHNGMNVPLGKEFRFVPILTNVRVFLFRPRDDQGGGILAMSKNGRDWDGAGANQTFSVKLKGMKDPVEWKTKSNVLSSRLTEFGTSDVTNPQSAPAASRIYEYLCYLPDYPDLSPCAFSLAKTAVPNGKAFNTILTMFARKRIPSYSLNAIAKIETKHKNTNVWTVPILSIDGHITGDIYRITKEIAETYGPIDVEYTQDDAEMKVDDKIEY